MQTHDTYVAWFWAKVDQDGPVPPHRPELGPCWLWTGGTDPDGYGICHFFARPYRAHRKCYELTQDDFDRSLPVLHHCDTPPCVRPSHLWQGTIADNNADMRRKRRHIFGDHHPSRTRPETRPRGSHHWAAKLTEAMVIEISERLAHGESGRALARLFGVSPSTISLIKRGKKWSHLAP